MQPLLVLNVVGLTPRLLGEHTPRLAAFASSGTWRPLGQLAPAVTCTMQATFLTGALPREHGVVGNGWLFRDLMEIWFWRQSNRLVGGEMVWDAGKARDARFTCANLCWWYNMAATFDVGLTPRPMYKADGRKKPDCLTVPAELRDTLQAKLGPFPLFQFWGPATSIASSRWIADAARAVLGSYDPTLTLVYLPHLDYDLQRFGPDVSHPAVVQSLRDIDEVAGALIADAQQLGRRILVLSEYGITPVDRPVHLNRVLRDAGLLAVRTEDGAELLDPVASRAFAIADHQLAHVHVADPADLPLVRRVVEQVPGVEAVWDAGGKASVALDHSRSGELVVLADAHSWFTYYYWLDDQRAPDFARTVEIHRKPGYDPVELVLDPAIRWPRLAIGLRLLRKALGFRTLMDVIPLDASLIRGSHGRPVDDPTDGALIMTDVPGLLPETSVAPTAVKQLMLDAVFRAS